jgi:hypothetical protein
MHVAMRDYLGTVPSREALALALAKTALETGRWKAIWCNNWGNIKAGEKHEGLYCTIALNEVLNGKVVWFSPRGRLDRKGGVVVAEQYDDPPGHPQTRMRAYGTRDEGARAYVAFVAGGRYALAWQRLLAGDAAGYATELRAKGYYTAPLADYLKGVVSLQREFIGKLGTLALEPETPSVPQPAHEAPAKSGLAAEYSRVTEERPGAGRALLEYEQAGLVDDEESQS